MTVNDGVGVGTGRYRMGSALGLGISFEKENERLMQEAAADAADTDAITLSTYGTYRRNPAMMHRSLTQFYSVDFLKSRIGVNKCIFNKRTIKVCVSCFDGVLGPPRLARHT